MCLARIRDRLSIQRIWTERSLNTMTKQQIRSAAHLTVREDQGLVGVVAIVDGKPVTEFFADDGAPVKTVGDVEMRAALEAIGAWADLDWDAAAEELDQIRHQSTPTPPLDL